MRARSILLCSAAVAAWSLGCSESDSAAAFGGKKDAGTAGFAGEGGGGGAAGTGASGGAGVGGGVTGQGGQAPCSPGAQQACYAGPPGTQGVGPCKAGIASCASGGTWGPCVGEVLPEPDNCLDNVDNDCDGVPDNGNHTAAGCACTAGDNRCFNDLAQVCNPAGDWVSAGAPCCKAGEFSCNCDEVMQCEPGPPPKWVPVSPAVVCDALAGQRCDAATGTCKPLTTIGSSVATGTYYRYAYFTAANSPLKVTGNVDDVASYGDHIYINRGPWYANGVALDVYKIKLLDSDGDGKLEPNQHPDNPNEPGPIEQRELEFVATYTAGPPDNAPMGIAHRGEMVATPDRIFTLGPKNDGDVTEYVFATKLSAPVVQSPTVFPLSQLGYGTGDGRWYGSHENHRRVYSFCPAVNRWVAEFQYPDLAGDHMDGMEVVVSFSTGVQYVYVSDMTSDFIGQYRRDSKGGWVQENLFQYKDAQAEYVEGMGFGALKHFWVTSGSALYELGGGDLTGYLQ